MRALISLGVAAAWLAGPIGSANSQEQAHAIVGTAVVDVGAGRIVPDQTIVFQNGRILAVQAGSAPLPDGAVRIDGTGLYALPGLIDSHVHYAAPDVYDPLMIACGVAVVRDLGGPMEPTLARRDQMNQPGYRGPRMLAAGPILDCNPPLWPFS